MIIIFYIICLILGIVVISDVLCLDTRLEILFLAFIALIAIKNYIISIIICSKRIKKSNEKPSLSKKALLFILLLIILPVLLFFTSFLKEY